MSEAQLDAVATFYNRIYRKPVGKHVVKVCDGVSCWMSGGDDIGQCILSLLGLERMGQTTPDGLFTVLPASCLGACDKAPVMMVDNELYVELSPESIVGIIERYTTGAAKPGE
jgi:NADH-quinone oxidoreductase subunit E